MGPRLLSRGKIGLFTGVAHGSSASMGPRLLSRGKAAYLEAREQGTVPLQWGRGC